MALPLVETFPGISGAALPSGYTTIAGSIEQGGAGDARSSFGGGAVSKVFWSDDVFSNDQYAQGRIYITNPSSVVGLMVRASGTGGGEYYVLYGYGSGNGMYVTKSVAGAAEDTVANILETFTNGDLLRIEVEGTTIRAYRNGAQMDTSVGMDMTGQSAIASGSGGFASYLASGSITEFETGNLSGGGGPAPTDDLLLLGVG
jgi:hypothetical protein